MRGNGADTQATAGSTARTKVCVLPDVSVHKTPPRSLGVKCLIPQLPQINFVNEGGIQVRDILFSHVANVTPLIFFTSICWP